MSVAKVIEISATSSNSFDDAVSEGIARASKTLHNIESAWVKDMTVRVEGGRITHYRANMLVTFVMDDEE